MITIVNYGSGNIRAFENAYKRLGVETRVACNAGELDGAEKIVLPGVGAFDRSMEKIADSGMRDTLDHLVLEEKVPVLAVCVGMQMFANSSEEGQLPGLGWIPGTVRSFSTVNPGCSLPSPHMGWNSIVGSSANPLFRDLEDQAFFYFLHSFVFECEDPGDSIAVASYGRDFTCAIARENIFGVQFHPEKSHRAGIRILANFAEMGN